MRVDRLASVSKGCSDALAFIVVGAVIALAVILMFGVEGPIYRAVNCGANGC